MPRPREQPHSPGSAALPTAPECAVERLWMRRVIRQKGANEKEIMHKGSNEKEIMQEPLRAMLSGWQ